MYVCGCSSPLSCCYHITKRKVRHHTLSGELPQPIFLDNAQWENKKTKKRRSGVSTDRTRRHLRKALEGMSPVLHRPQKNVISPIFCTNLRLEAPVPVYFSCTFHRSAATSATLLVPKCTTWRWTLRCSNYGVAKRQQFSCALSTATSSLKFENVVPEGWIWFFPFYI